MGKLGRGLKVQADALIHKCVDEHWDAIILPGGMPGAKSLRFSEDLMDILFMHASEGKLIGAICASPAVVLQYHGLLNGVATSHPAPRFTEDIDEWTDEKVVVNGNIITSQGPGTSLQFALKIVEALWDKKRADRIARELLTTND